MGRLSDALSKANISFPGRKSSSGTDYRIYEPKLKDILVFSGKMGGILLVGSLVFYNTLLPAFFLFPPVFVIFGKREVKRLIEKRKEQLKTEFLTELLLLGDLLRSGHSFENALRATEKELLELYGEGSDMLSEIRLMMAGFSLSRTPEELFLDLSERADVPEIREFASVFSLVNRTGGQIREVIQGVSESLTEAFAVEEEIRTMIASKRMEQRIMDVMPAAILLYVKTASPELLKSMYETLSGRLIMTGCLLVYVLAYYWSEKIMDIRMTRAV